MEVGAYEAKTHLPKLLERVARGERITITKHGKPVAELIPANQPDLAQRRKAVDDLYRLGEELRDKGVHITKDEILAWKNEGRR